MAVLIGMSGTVTGQSFDVEDEAVTIGRTDENTIVLDDPAVSSRHCMVVREGEVFLLRDTGSTNGTRLNTREVTEARLKPKDLIRVGSTEFMFDGAGLPSFEDDRESQTEVEVEAGPVAAPESFDSISPFGARPAEGNRALWYVIIALIGLLALAAVAILFFNLVTAG